MNKELIAKLRDPRPPIQMNVVTAFQKYVTLTPFEAKQIADLLEGQENLLAKAIALLKDYEQWEADIISEDELWQPYTAKDVMRGHIYDTMMELQGKRNELLQNIEPC